MDKIENVTVLLPAYNNSTTIELFLDTLVRQSMISFVDLIIHDDKSTDATVQIIEEHGINELCHSVTLVKRQENYYKKNKNWLFLYDLLLKSNNDIIFFSEADD